MKICYICKTQISKENESKEHIFLNSIGGKLKPKDLICRTCNSDLGHNCDSALAEQLSFLASFLRVKRDDKKKVIIKGLVCDKGIAYNLENGSTPVLARTSFREDKNGKETILSINVRDKKELKKVLKGVEKKYENFTSQEVLAKIKEPEKYLGGGLRGSMTVGGDEPFRSITKTAVNYWVYKTGDIQNIEHLISYLKGDENKDIVRHFQFKELPYQKEILEVSHLIHIHGDEESKKMYAYIEFFSCFSFLVEMSNNYLGKNISDTYCFNVIDSREVERTIDFDFKKIPSVDSGDMWTNLLNKRLSKVIGIGEKIQYDSELERIFKKTWDDIFDEHRDKESLLSVDEKNRFNELLAKRLANFSSRGTTQ